MNTHTMPVPPAKTAAFGFLGLMGLAAVVATADTWGILDRASAQRLLGLIVGLVVLITGNLLPKLRPLRGSAADPTDARVAEQFAGRLLVLIGIVYLGAFVIAPLRIASVVAAVLGLGAMLGIAGKWILLLVGASFDHPVRKFPDVDSDRNTHRLTIWLLFGFSYVVVSACMAFLVTDASLRSQLAWYLLLGYWLIYSVILSALGVERPVR
ncbi:MAG: hypothetical protein ABI411_14205 [Tahibacter sp.]